MRLLKPPSNSAWNTFNDEASTTSWGNQVVLVPHHSCHNRHSSRAPQRFDLLLAVYHTKLFLSLQFKEFWLTAQPTVTVEQEYAAVLTRTKPTSQQSLLPGMQDPSPLSTCTARLCLVFVLGGTKTFLLAASRKRQSVRIAFTSVKA